jgi:hypothetical protein
LKNQQIFELIRKARKCIAVIDLVMIHLIFQNKLIFFNCLCCLVTETVRKGGVIPINGLTPCSVVLA